MLDLDHWRPLTLLNSDNKLFTKVIANRLEGCIPHIIHPSQTGFIKGRQLAENILKIMEVVHACNIKKQNALLVSFDFCKTFNSIEWEAIYLALEKFGFGPYFIKMIQIV